MPELQITRCKIYKKLSQICDLTISLPSCLSGLMPCQGSAFLRYQLRDSKLCGTTHLVNLLVNQVCSCFNKYAMFPNKCSPLTH